MRPGDLPVDVMQDRSWRSRERAIPVAVTTGAIALLLLAYRDAAVSLIDTWIRSETFNHCFLVLPISLWLMWRERDRLSAVPLKPFPAGLAVLAALNAIWLVGDAASIQTLREFALVASVPMVIVTLLGLRFARAAAFPLLFMFFAWPVGDFLVPPLINYTADFAAAAVRMSGVPVFRQGNSFVIPSGEWSVVGACSGIRYLIASVFAGSFFAYISFRTWRWRLAFIALSIVVPIVANWVRAYLIVMIGHLTSNKLAAGADHLIYGWVFFGFVMTALFYVGMRMSNAEARRVTPSEPGPPALPIARRPAVGMVLATAVAAVLVGFAAPSWSAHAARTREALSAAPLTLTAPPPEGQWAHADASVTEWVPLYKNPTAEFRQTYREDGDVELYVAFYRNQKSDAKLLTFIATSLVGYDPQWRFEHRRQLSTPAGQAGPDVEELRVESRQGNFLVWQWYWLDGRETTRVWEAKLIQARTRMAGALDQSAAVLLMAPYADDPTEARNRLERFVRDMYPSIVARLHAAAGGSARD